jgi:flagellar export protein FliJ
MVDTGTMRRFRFELQNLLRLRGQLERAARRDLATALGAVAVIERRIEVARQGLGECAEHAAGTDPAARLARALEAGLRRHQWRLGSELRRAEAQLERTRTAFVERQRDARVLQRLRERALAEWQQAASACEQAEIEELARAGRAQHAATHGVAVTEGEEA